MQSKALSWLILPKRSLYQWNLMIRASTSDNLYAHSLAMYSFMLNSGVHGNSHTYPLLFKSCAHLRSIHDVKQLHTHVVKLGFQSDVFVQTSLTDAYSSCSHLGAALQVFDEMPERSGVTWSCMINGYSRQGKFNESFLLLKDMILFEFELGTAALVGVLEGCDYVQGLSLHCCAVKTGLCLETELLNSMMRMYLKCGSSDGAWAVFNTMEEKSVVSWTIMIQGFANAGDFSAVFSLFRNMRLELGTSSMDAGVFVSLISGCWQIGDNLLAASVHCLVLKSGLVHHSPIDITLVSVYADCSDIVSSRAVFDAAEQKDVSLWTAMIRGYVQLGRPREALDLFHKLRAIISPNEVTILTVLSACADLGSLSAAEETEKYIIARNLESDLRVQTSLIHCYCKCGSIDKAESVFQRVVDKDLAVWSAMINTCTIHGLGTKALRLFDQMQTEGGIKPDAVVYTSIFLACSYSGLVEDGLRHFNTMQIEFGIKANLEHYCCLVDLLSRAGKFNLALKTIQESPFHSQSRIWTPLLSACRTHINVKVGELAAKKLLDLDPGWSRIEIAGSLHVLVAADRSHQRTNDIYRKLNELNVQLGEAGYVAVTEMVTQDLEDEEKEDAVKVHSERLAVVLGLLSTEEGSTLRIVKNHFDAGLCSCNDFW